MICVAVPKELSEDIEMGQATNYQQFWEAYLDEMCVRGLYLCDTCEKETLEIGNVPGDNLFL